MVVHPETFASALRTEFSFSSCSSLTNSVNDLAQWQREKAGSHSWTTSRDILSEMYIIIKGLDDGVHLTENLSLKAKPEELRAHYQ